MPLREYFDEIESFEFGAQFTIFSGFSLVLSDMFENQTLQKLVAELLSDRYKITALTDRIHQFLENPQIDNQMAFDGSLASYLFCLWKADIEAGYDASHVILNTPDLWWSAKLALLIRNEYLEEQISNSVELWSHKIEPMAFAVTGSENPVFTSLAHSSCFLNELVISPIITREFEYKRSHYPRSVKKYISWKSLGSQMTDQNWSNTTQEFEIVIADD